MLTFLLLLVSVVQATPCLSGFSTLSVTLPPSGTAPWHHHPSSQFLWSWNTTNTTHSTRTRTYESQSTSTVTVGAAGKLVFAPSTISAPIGSIISFDFLALNHTLTQSELWDPCHPNGKFDSGFRQFNPGNVSGKFRVEYEVTDSRPRWFFCSQTVQKSHCHAGMVFSLNPQGAHQQFLQNAMASVTSKSPTSVSACRVPTFTFRGNSTLHLPTASASGSRFPIGPTSVQPPITNSGARNSVYWIGFGLGLAVFG